MRATLARGSVETARWHLSARKIGRRRTTPSGWLYRDVDLDLQPGDRFALVGPTGSGKSLILRALAILDPLDQGEILWNREPVADKAVPGYRSQVLYLHQSSPVIEGTVEDNLAIPFSVHLRKGSELPRDKVRQFLDILGRDLDFLTSRTANLSGGERQIVALLRALLVAPTVLLLDEPTAALDPQATEALERLVRAWYESAPTERAYIWVSHDPTQAQRVGEKIIRIKDGRIEAHS